MGDLVADGELDLFSQQTIAVRKKAFTTRRPTRSQAARPGQAAASSAEESGLRLVRNQSDDGSGLQLTDVSDFGGEPVAKRNAPNAARAPQGSVRLKPGGSGSVGYPDAATGKIVFRCCHCHRSLAVRPVTKMSKLACPGCRNELFVTADGRLLTASGPQAGGGGGSFVVRQADSVRVVKERPGSAPVRKEGSLSLRLSEASGDAHASQTTPTEKLPTAVRPRSPARDVDSCRLRTFNPGAGAAARPPSAFEEHESSDDPAKTVFISEETTKSLQSSLSLSELAAAVPPRPKSARDVRAAAGRRGQPSTIVRKSAKQSAGDKRALRPHPVGVALRVFLLTTLLSAPVILTGSLLTQTVFPRDGEKPRDMRPPYVLENLGRICTQGARELFGVHPDIVLAD